MVRPVPLSCLPEGDAVILSSLPLVWTWVVLVGHYQPLTLVSCLARCLVIHAGHVSWVLLSLPVPLGSPVEGLASLLWMLCALGAIIS